MEESPPDSGKPPRNSAAGRSFNAIPEGLLRYLEARGVLLSIEGQEAAQQLSKVIFRGVVAAILGLSGWLMLMVGIMSYLVVKLEWTWGLATVVGALANLLLATFIAFDVSRRLATARWFEHTLNEFGKDRKWLEQLNDRH